MRGSVGGYVKISFLVDKKGMTGEQLSKELEKMLKTEAGRTKLIAMARKSPPSYVATPFDVEILHYEDNDV